MRITLKIILKILNRTFPSFLSKLKRVTNSFKMITKLNNSNI